jgi:hypothetical protein
MAKDKPNDKADQPEKKIEALFVPLTDITKQTGLPKEECLDRISKMHLHYFRKPEQGWGLSKDDAVKLRSNISPADIKKAKNKTKEPGR